jgi:integrator complex subunit 3
MFQMRTLLDKISAYTKREVNVQRAVLHTITCTRVSGADTLVLSLVRQVATGDLTEANVWLACNLLHTLKGAAAWMFRSASLTQAVLFKYLRLLPDAARGTKSGEVALSQHAIALCTRILTERWEIAASMGRDLARALQDVSQIAEFKALWKELLSGRPPGSGAGPPATICGADDVLAKLLSTRTPTTVLQAGLTQDMEKEMYFMLTQVRMGNQKRYQQWFMARHLSLPDSETVVPDLVRYICGCYHPPNHILSSEIIPRW